MKKNPSRNTHLKKSPSKLLESINNSIVIYGGRIPLYLSEEGFFNGIEREDTNIEKK